MAHRKVYMKYMDKLVKALPMDDVTFTTQLTSNEILPASVAAHIKSLPTKSDKADYYLKNVIETSLDIDEITEFEKLIVVMEKCGYPHIERMANKMKSDLDKELKAKSSSKSGAKGTTSAPAKSSESSVDKGKKPDDVKPVARASVKRSVSKSAQSSETTEPKKKKTAVVKSSQSTKDKGKKPANADGNKCSEATENITKHYTKLTRGFPTDGLVPQLYSEKVINDEQKEEIQKKTLKKDKVSFLFDVIKSELEVGISTKYDNLIKVMKASDDSTAKRLADLLEGTAD